MRKAIFFYNPKSGNRGVPNKLDYIMGRFQEKGILIQPYRLQDNNNEKVLATLKENKYDFAVVSGGDGTLNVITNILLKNGLDLPVGVIPGGTCNDFARSLSIPSTLNECIDVILDGKISKIDAGLINGEQYFLNSCAGGVFVDVSFSTHSELKKNFGPFAYYLKALTEVKNIKPFKLKVSTDTEVFEEEALLFLILNGKDAAGFSNIMREADFSDGMMDIVIVKSCSHIDLASLFFSVLTNELINNKNVTKLKTRNCYMESGSNITLSVDGDKGTSLPAEVKFINKALKVFVK